MSYLVFVLDDDPDVREALCAVIEALTGQPCLPLPSLRELAAARTEALRCHLGILDVNLGDHQPSGVDAHAWLLTQGFAGRIVFLTGHGLNDPRVRRALEVHEVRVLQKPIDLDTLRELLEPEGMVAA
jgi:FixJ family two-component response regulator